MFENILTKELIICIILEEDKEKRNVVTISILHKKVRWCVY